MDFGGLRSRRLNARWGMLALITGGILGALQFAVLVSVGTEARAASISALVSGTFFGLILGPVTARTNGRYRDPRVREPARRALAFQLGRLDRMRIWAPVVFGLLAAAIVDEGEC